MFSRKVQALLGILDNYVTLKTVKTIHVHQSFQEMLFSFVYYRVVTSQHEVNCS